MRAVFQRSDMSLVDIKCPWGMLPYLRLGAAYQDGSLLSDDFLGTKQKLYFNQQVKTSVLPAKQALTRKQYPLESWQNYNENCVVIETSAAKIVVPCIEVIRAFYVMNRYLAHEILKPASFIDIPMILEGRKVKMYFNTVSQFRSLTPEAIKVMALAQFDPAWSESWKNVWIRRKLRYINDYKDKNYIPLECLPPIARDCTWYVRSQENTGVVFVYEVMGFSIPQEYPFVDIECWYDKADETGDATSPGRISELDSGETVKADQSEAGPEKPNQPIHIEIDIPKHKFKSNPRIISIPNKQPVYASKSNPNQHYRIHRKRLSESLNVSFNEQSALADVHSAEFISYVNDPDVPDTLMPIFKAIDSMRKLNPVLNVAYRIGEIPDNCPVLRHDEFDIRYALFEIRLIDEKIVYILELGLPDIRRVSTIFFKTNSIYLNSDHVVAELLSDCMSKSGSWDVSSLYRIEKLNILLARHTGVSSGKWGHRLKRKIFALMNL